jgi:cytochrome P450
LFRTAIKPSVVSGAPIQPDHKMLVSIAAANRDPRKWTEPDRFDIRRNAVDHLAFGRGIHVCAGMNVAKLEAECLLTSFLRRVRSLQPMGETRFILNNTVRRLESLPLKVVRD